MNSSDKAGNFDSAGGNCLFDNFAVAKMRGSKLANIFIKCENSC